MKVFLSWSGIRSKAVAESLKLWIPQLIQAVDPWISVDIDKGRRWDSEIAAQLEESRVGIICLTRDNLEAPWLHFEAGALSKTKDAYVCTLLLDIKAAEVQPPLGLFQHTIFKKEEVYKLLQTINLTVAREGERAPGEAVLSSLFDKLWPELEESMKAILTKAKPEKTPVRSDRDILQEILDIVRIQERRLEPDVHYSEKLPPFEPQLDVGPTINNLAELKQLWPTIILHIRKKIGVTASAYLHDATPSALDETHITLGFKKEFHHAKAVEASRRLPFEQVINEFLAIPRNLRFIIESGQAPR